MTWRAGDCFCPMGDVISYAIQRGTTSCRNMLHSTTPQVYSTFLIHITKAIYRNHLRRGFNLGKPQTTTFRISCHPSFFFGD